MGLIPAHAGKTGHQPPPPGRHSAHPRSRGENRIYTEGRAIPGGSSPLTRGKRRTHMPQPCDPRLIPAHAGKTLHLVTVDEAWAAHPRSRGENASELSEGLTPTGSSPLTRGKRLFVADFGNRRGLIPAHAGKTSCSSGCESVDPAHPRSRGENAARAIGIGRQTGSSPLTRGKPRGRRMQSRQNGLIPAHAGKTR